MYFMQQRATGTTDPFDENGIEAKTDKWRTFIPETLKNQTQKKVLVVHDAALSGKVIHAVRAALVEVGFNRDYVKTAALILTKGVSPVEPPDFFGIEIGHAEIKMPWGHINRTERLKRQNAILPGITQ